MTARYLMMLTLALGAAAGCTVEPVEPTPTSSAGDDDDDDDDDDDTTTTPPPADPPEVDDTACDTATTDCGGGHFTDFTSIFVESQFGYDAATGRAATIDYAGYALPPSIDIVLATSSWQYDYDDTANYCFVSLSLENSVPSAEAAADARLYWGAEYDPADPVSENCSGRADPAIWGSDVAYSLVGYYVGIDPFWTAAGDPTPDVETTLAPYLGADAVYLVGGALGIPWLGGQIDEVYGFAYAVDRSMALQFDASGYAVPLDASTLDLGGNMRSAWYSLDSLVYWTLSP